VAPGAACGDCKFFREELEVIAVVVVILADNVDQACPPSPQAYDW